MILRMFRASSRCFLYPNYYIGDPVHTDVGQVLGPRIYEGVEHFRISVPIVKGNSGGPIFNGDGRVIGIATKGVDTDDIVNVQQNGSLYLADLSAIIAPFIQ